MITRINKTKALCSFLHGIGMDPEEILNSEDKNKYQMTVYLLQRYGIVLGYVFDTKNKCVFSQDLDATLNSLDPAIIHEAISLARSESVTNYLNDFKNEFENILNDPATLDLFTTMDFTNRKMFSGFSNKIALKKAVFAERPELMEILNIDKKFDDLYLDVVIRLHS